LKWNHPKSKYLNPDNLLQKLTKRGRVIDGSAFLIHVVLAKKANFALNGCGDNPAKFLRNGKISWFASFRFGFDIYKPTEINKQKRIYVCKDFRFEIFQSIKTPDFF
jgi:hypothetical protein